jgi:hypothetical protein
MIAGKHWVDELGLWVTRSELWKSFISWAEPQTWEVLPPKGDQFLNMFSFLNIHVGKHKIHLPAIETAKQLFSRETHIGFWATAPPI